MRPFLWGVAGGWAAGVAALRQRSPVFDHVWRARERYRQVYAGRLAAAIAYYGFFAVFALATMVFAALGFARADDGPVVRAVEAALQRNLPQLTLASISAASGRVGMIAFAGLVIAGVAWVEALRSSQRAIWGLEQQPGNRVVRWLVDMAVLVGLGVLLTLSVSISAGVRGALLRWVDPVAQPALRGTLSWVANRNLAAVADLVLAAALLAWVPRLRISPRRLVAPALLIAGGMALLKTVGRWYVAHTEHNPAYHVVAGTAGLLIFIYLFNRLLLFAAALAATSEHGMVTDLADERPAAMSGPDHHAEAQTPAANLSGKTEK